MVWLQGRARLLVDRCGFALGAAWLVVLVGCTLDTRPELLERSGGRTVQPNSGAVAGSGFALPSLDAGPQQPFNPVQPTPVDLSSGGAMPVAGDAFGLSCANVPCPVAPSGTRQCCTRDSDVQGRIARGYQRCGLDLFGDGRCTELEQPGITDARCSNGTPLGAVLEEAGCCTEQGLCGTLNVSHGLGCHYSGDAAPAACGDDGIDPGVSCDLAGVYGLRVRVDVAWGGNSGGLFDLTDAGRGFIEIYLRAAIDTINDDLSFSSTVLPCGAELPPFYSSILCESYQPIFPERIWDEGEVPLLPVAGQVQCLHPGCVLSMDAATGLIGILLDNPEGPWPTAEETTRFSCGLGSGVACFPDHDLDGEPGVTVELRNHGSATGVQGPPGSSCGGTYAYRGAPLNANLGAIFGGVKRADRLQLGTRVRLGGSARIGADCLGGLGTGLADFVQSRAAACFAQPGTADPFEPLAGANDPCTEAEALFMNQNLPAYHILRYGDLPPPQLGLTGAAAEASVGPEFVITRLAPPGAEVSCAQVRDAAY